MKNNPFFIRKGNGLFDYLHCDLISSFLSVFHFVNAPFSFLVSRGMHNSWPTVLRFSNKKRWRPGRRLKRLRNALGKSWDLNNAITSASRKRWKRCNTNKWFPSKTVRESFKCARTETLRKPRSSSPSLWASMKKRSRPSWKFSRTTLARPSRWSTYNG